VIRRIRGIEGLWSEMRVRVDRREVRVRVNRREGRVRDSRRGKEE
jgi:hypothetical protein